MSTTDDVRAAIVAEARSWLNTPWHHMAHVKGAGVDCAWMAIEIYSALGLIERFDPGYYPADWAMHRDDERYLQHVVQCARQVETPLPGDLALYKFGRAYSHGAIVTSWPGIIHALRDVGRVIEDSGTVGRLTGRPVLFYSVVPD